VHHYSFFVQQDWLDRSSLLEDFRMENFATGPGALKRNFMRMNRILKQGPRRVITRLGYHR